MARINSCVFISGAGTNLKNLIHSSRNYNFPINIKLVISNKKNALGLTFAKKHSIPFRIINTNERMFETKLLNEIKRRKINLICLAGYMKILSRDFIKNYKGKIINIHPSLLPKYKGTNTYSRILNNGEKKTGCTVHFVDDKLDSGKIILKKKIKISKYDNYKTLEKKVLKTEHSLYPQAIKKFLI